MSRLLLSAALLLLISSTFVLNTTAFFSGSATSTGNKFEAATFDLDVDNITFHNDEVDNDGWVQNKVLFNFSNIMPGDFGDNKITLNLAQHDFYACTNVELTSTPENGVGNPEENSGDTTDNGNWDGDLQNYVSFVMWVDEVGGDGKYDPSREVRGGVLSDLVLETNNSKTYTLADSLENLFANNTDPLTHSEDYNVYAAWCFGDLTPTADEGNRLGLDCNVNTSLNYNNAQSDSVEGSLHFYVAQSKHNENFSCNVWDPTQSQVN